MYATPKFPTLLQRWFELLSNDSGPHAHNATVRMGISEGQIVAARCREDTAPPDTIRLRHDFKGLLRSLGALGEVLAITRNAYAVHEKRSVYRNLSLDGPYCTALGPSVDLHYNFLHWAHGFAVTEDTDHGPSKSLQFFDRDGTAVHKLYATDNTDNAAWQKMVARFSAHDQTSGLIPVSPVLDYPVERNKWSDARALRKEWKALTDASNFQPLLRKFKLRRIDALKLASADLARRVPSDAWHPILQQVADIHLPIRMTVASPGVVQIHTGPIHRLNLRGGWFNILDPGFNLRLCTRAVHQVWVVYRPTDEGGVTSLELYDRSGELIAQIFGAREPGVSELAAWRSLLSDIPDSEAVTETSRATIGNQAV